MKYALAEKRLAAFAEAHGIPVAETQAGKGSLAWDHPCNAGAIGVTGSSAANALAAKADLVLAIGSRLGDFATGSRALFADAKLVQLNVGAFDAAKHGARPAGRATPMPASRRLAARLKGWKAPAAWTSEAARLTRAWNRDVERITAPSKGKPTDAQVLGVVNARAARRSRSWCAPRAACRASCTSCGAPAIRPATTSNTATRAWATRSPAASARSSRIRGARCA